MASKDKNSLKTVTLSGASLPPRDETLTRALEHAARNAERSRSLLGLMEEQGIRLEFSPTSLGGVCKVDATLNPTGAYKVRGALASAYEAKRQGLTTLVTASAGNHGAGLAYAAQQMGLKAVIYVPKNAPLVKIETIRSFGAEVRLVGESFDECLAQAQQDPALLGGSAKFVHPFDDSTVVAGQGTIGYELLARLKREVAHKQVDKVRVVLPIGGGGLAAGVVSVLKTQWPQDFPKLEVIGVVDESSPASLVAMLRGRPVRALTDTIADGTKVEMVGESFLKVAHLLDGLVLLPHDELVQAMRKHYNETGCKLEGAGALALGAEEVLRRDNPLGDTGATLSFPLVTGRNIDPARFDAEVSAEARMNKKLRLRQGFDVVFDETPGQLLRFLEAVKDYNIASLTYVKQVDSLTGRLQVEFEVDRSKRHQLAEILMKEFPGSKKLPPGRHMVYMDGVRGTEEGSERLIPLADHPGSFLTCVRELTQAGTLGSVDFLFYRKPAKRGAVAQVIMGQESSAPEIVGTPNEFDDVVMPPVDRASVTGGAIA